MGNCSLRVIMLKASSGSMRCRGTSFTDALRRCSACGVRIHRECNNYHDEGMKYAIVIVPRSGGLHRPGDSRGTPGKFQSDTWVK